MKPLHITLRQLQIFVAIAQHGTTTAASEVIALSQSAVSAALNELERTLATQLFDRVGKRLLLNENGTALLRQCHPLLDMAENIETSVQNTHKYLHAVKIGSSTTIGNYVLPKLLQQLSQNPGAEVGNWNTEIVINNTAEICQQVSKFELDLGLIEGPCHDSALKVYPWQSDDMLVVMSPQNPLFGMVEQNFAQVLPHLQAATWLLREQGSGTRVISDNMILPKLGAYQDCLELSSSEAIKQCAVLGLGLACLSQWVVEDELKQGKLMRLDHWFRPQTRECSWVCHHNKVLQPALQQVLVDLGCEMS